MEVAMPRAGVKGRQGFPKLGPNEVTHHGEGVSLVHMGKDVALVDNADLPLILTRRWCVDSVGYAASSRTATQPAVRMHRMILGLKVGDRRQVDHINHDRLDNRRSNLRVVTVNQNQQNKLVTASKKASIYKGVTKSKQRDRWRAYIKLDQRQINLGVFATEEEAARAYDAAAILLFGEFACLNLPLAPTS